MSKITREEFETILEEAFVKGYNNAIEDIIKESKNSKIELFAEGFIKDLKNDIKTWYKRRLTSDEIKEAEKEFKSIMSRIKLPKGISFKYNIIIKKGTYEVKPIKIGTNKFHILDKNAIANFTISEVAGNSTSWKMTTLVHKILDALNENSKNFKYVVHKTIISTNAGGYEGEIFAYRKKDNIEKDMPCDKGNRINTLQRQTIIVY